MGRAFTPSVLLPTFAGQRATVSRGRNRAQSGNGTYNVPFPSSQAAKSPPGFLQESACSPLERAPKMKNFTNQECICSSSRRSLK